VLHDPAVVDGFVSGLHEIIQWLTGYSKEEIDRSIEENLTFEQFFASANLNKNATLIKGSICGYDIEKISNSLTKCVWMLDKSVDELAKGKKLENILR